FCMPPRPPSSTPFPYTTPFRSLSSVAHMKRFMNEKRPLAPTISVYADSLHDCPAIREQVQHCIRNGKLTDQASKALADARRQIALIDTKIERKVSQTLT